MKTGELLRPLADWVDETSASGISVAEFRAELALRAAAPDMYGALVALVNMHDIDPGPVAVRYNSLWQAARAAVAKAQAGTPDRKPQE